VAQYYIWSVLSYILFFAATIAASIPSSIVLTLLGGYLFGAIAGAGYATCAVTLGVGIAYLIYRRLLVSSKSSTYQDAAQRFEQAMKEQGRSYLLVLHFSAVLPYFVINSLAALARVPVWTVVWTAAVGFLPQGLIYAFAGKELGSITTVNDIFTTPVVVAFLLLLVLAFIPIIVRRYKQSSLKV